MIAQPPAGRLGPGPFAAAPSLAVVGAMIVGGLALIALAAPLIAPYDPDRQVTAPFAEPSSHHLLGADDLGQDLLSQLIYGARVSLMVGIGSATIATLLATGVGLVAGVRRGWLDSLLMRLVDILLALPLLPLLLVLSTFLDPGALVQAVTIGLILAPRAAREIRSQALAVSRLGPVDASRSMGAGGLHVLWRHLLPGSTPVVVAQFVRAVSVAVVFESSLSFLGLGDPTSRSWGTILFFANARGASLSNAWTWWVIPPGLCIGLTVVAFALIGHGVEERSDLRLRSRPWRLSRKHPRNRHHARLLAHAPPLLKVDELTVDYGEAHSVRALDGVSFEIDRGELIALVGPSGSGKSTLASAIMGMLPVPGRIVAGSVVLDGKDLAAASDGELRGLRGRLVALVPQAAMSALNPVTPVLDQVAEAVRAHQPVSRSTARARAQELLAAAGLPADRANAFPHQLSGGMRQRVAIAMAIANAPLLIVADEPTTGLDVVAQVEILELLAGIRRRTGAAMVIVTHDRPGLLLRTARVLALADGGVVESPPPGPGLARPVAGRGPLALDEPGDQPLLELSGLRKAFAAGAHRRLREVLRGVDLRLNRGEIVGLVGRSGTGKTTLARIVGGLISPDGGSVTFAGVDLLAMSGRARRRLRRDIQLIGQDPYGWIPPRLTVRQVVEEPLVIHRAGSRSARDELVREALADVGLQPVARYLNRYPHELSGGERQRVALARALVLRPALIVADEPSSMLDAESRDELVGLIARLRDGASLAFLYITHDLALASTLCDRILVMDEGRVVEECDPQTLAVTSHQRATQALLDAAKTLGGFRTRSTRDGD